jgi:hypothetical protein
MGFTCACLAVCENCSVITLEYAFDDGQGCLFKDAFLEAAWFEGEVEAKDSFFFSDFFGVVD